MVPVIRIDDQVMEELKKRAVALGLVFEPPNATLRRVLGLASTGFTEWKRVGQMIEIKVWPAYIRYKYIGIRKEYQHLFPDFGTKVDLTTDEGDMFTMKVYNNGGSMELWDSDGWFDKHPGLKVGDKLRIETFLEPGKRYKLSIV